MMLSGCGGGFGALGCIVSAGGCGSAHRRRSRRLRLRLLRRDVHGDAVERQVSPLRLRIRRRLRPALRSPCGARFGGGVARLLDLELIVEHRLAERRRRLQAGHFEQHAVGAEQFGLDEAARIGGGIDEIAGRAAARAETEAIERNQGCLRIAGHRISLELFLAAYIGGGLYRRSR